MIVRMEAEVEGLREILEVEWKRAEELRQERDRWASALEASQRQITDLTKKAESVSGRGFLGWLRRSA
ncbi:hypothetical protein JKG68_31720 [Microvirga aerilata]|uniref:Uncharacterized protein n=1 Tax=Microvirga aerilata TaxID=670292 RepID=A0A937D435_9HYPH|nr:hypothetical protein [Microvirga aerilata]MBL0408437.1 hypothetical protein [Microvirga aerilata]